MGNRVEGAVVAVIAKISPETLLLSRFHDVYEQSRRHKFDAGDVLVASKIKDGDSYWAGYTHRPVAVVLAYEKGERNTYHYRVNMYGDRGPDEERLSRTQQEETHFKWNIENQFERLPKGTTPEAALAAYRK